MKYFGTLLVSAMVLTFGSPADAQVLTFNELAPPDNPILGSIECTANGSGFRFFSDHFHLIGIGNTAVFEAFTSNDTAHIGYESGRGFPVTMARVGAGTFSLFSLDAAEFYAQPVPDRPDAERLTITGFQAGGGTVTHTLTLDGVRDGPGGVVDFQHFTLPGTFVNLTSVVFTGLRGVNEAGGVTVDNLQYTLSVPGTIAPCVLVPLPSDTPTVAITSPAAGNVMGTVAIQATASDNVGVEGVQFKIDGANLGAEDVTAPYAASWDTTLVPDGSHTITAEARDAAGNIGTAAVVVNVRNTPVNTNTPHYVEFDGANDYAEVGDSPLLSFGSGATDTPLTFEMWLRPDTLAGKHQFVSKWGETTNQEYRLYAAANVIRLDLRDQSAQATVSAYTTSSQAGLVGAWHHLAVTYDGRGGSTAAAGITIYIDGVAVPVTRINSAAYVAMENLGATLQIGREGPAWRQYDGGFDDLRMWGVARTPAEIQAFMAMELTGLEPGLRGYWRFNEGAGNAVEDDSPASQAAALFNGTAWVAGGPLSGPDDGTPPEITGITLTGLTATGITVRFNTSETATGWVSYTAGAACPCTDVYSAGAGTLHVVTLTGLTPDTPYQFQVHASDPAGNSQVSSWMSFRTLLPPPDTTPPTVTITQPAGTVTGTVQIAATANDNVGVVGVQFKIDGAFFGPMDGTAPYGVAWDTRTAADGPHTITADAVDAMGNVGSASVQVTVNNTVPTASPHYLEFDGANDYLEASDSNALSFGNGAADTPLSFEMWIRPDVLSGKHQLVSKWGETSNQEYRLYIATNVIRLDLRDQSAQATISAYTTSSQAGLAGAWHHLAVTYDGRGGSTAAAGITIYIDGIAVPVTRANSAAYVAMENLGATLRIGHEAAAWRQYDGGLDDLRMWNVARTLAQIQASRSIELAGTETGLVGYWRFNQGAGTTTVDGSPSGLTATLFNGVSWTAGGPLAPVGPDLTPPVITNIQTPNLMPTSVTVTFTTNETATGWVSYTAAPACPCTDVFGAGPTTAHTINLTGLTPQTTYQFQVKASDAAGNLRVGPNLSFQTPALPPDTTPPTVTITGPAAGNVMGVIQVTATAVDTASAVAQVRFLIDGGAIATTLSPPYGTTWDTGTVPDGLHTITVEAVDTFGNLGTASVIVNVRNTPVVTTPHFVEMDGVNDYVEIADGNAISFGNGASDTPFTIEMWIRPDTMATKQQLVGKWGETSNQEYRLYTGGGTIRLDLRDNSTQATVSAYTGSVTALAGGWHHLAATYDGRGGATAAAGITIYIDGTAVALTRMNSASYVAMENLGASLQVGHESTAWKQFDGGLDELRLWTVARTASQIQTARTTELTGAEAGLVGYWRFNEGSGTSSDDSSAGNLAATLNSGAFFGAGGPLTTP